MKGIVYRSAALTLAFVVACSALAVPASATDYQSTYNFWNWAYDNSWFLGKAIIGFSAGNVCQVSEDGLHHATTHSGGGGSVDGQRVYNCVCDLCGVEFQAVATDLKETYEVNVYNLPTTNISHDGSFTFNSKWYLYEFGNTNCCAYSRLYELPECFNKSDILPHYEHGDYVYRVTHSSSDKATFKFRANIQFETDVTLNLGQSTNCYTGPESFTSSIIYNYYIFNANTGEQVYHVKYDFGKTEYSYTVSAGVPYYIELTFEVERSWNPNTIQYILVDFPMITGKLVTATEYKYVRPTQISPSFTYEDENGTETVSDQQIIDEQGLNYYNPVTNTTTNITNWTYDYSDRSYTCITENNTTTTITYGDEFITINEGDNITYNIYYYTAPDSSGDGDNSGAGGSGDGTSLWDKIGKLFGELLGGLVDVISGVISGLLDSLIDLVTVTLEKLSNVVNLFGSLGDALKVLWSWLPDEVVTVLVSGVTVIIFASVIKLFVK